MAQAVRSFLPSETARLVLGYLKEMGCQKSYESFLSECPALREYSTLLHEGKEYATQVGGKSLLDILEEYSAIKLLGVHPKHGSNELWTQVDVVLGQLRALQNYNALVERNKSFLSVSLNSIDSHFMRPKPAKNTSTTSCTVQAQSSVSTVLTTASQKQMHIDTLRTGQLPFADHDMKKDGARNIRVFTRNKHFYQSKDANSKNVGANSMDLKADVNVSVLPPGGDQLTSSSSSQFVSPGFAPHNPAPCAVSAQPPVFKTPVKTPLKSVAQVNMKSPRRKPTAPKRRSLEQPGQTPQTVPSSEVLPLSKPSKQEVIKVANSIAAVLNEKKVVKQPEEPVPTPPPPPENPEDQDINFSTDELDSIFGQADHMSYMQRTVPDDVTDAVSAAIGSQANTEIENFVRLLSETLDSQMQQAEPTGNPGPFSSTPQGTMHPQDTMHVVQTEGVGPVVEIADHTQITAIAHTMTAADHSLTAAIDQPAISHPQHTTACEPYSQLRPAQVIKLPLGTGVLLPPNIDQMEAHISRLISLEMNGGVENMQQHLAANPQLGSYIAFPREDAMHVVAQAQPPPQERGTSKAKGSKRRRKSSDNVDGSPKVGGRVTRQKTMGVRTRKTHDTERRKNLSVPKKDAEKSEEKEVVGAEQEKQRKSLGVARKRNATKGDLTDEATTSATISMRTRSRSRSTPRSGSGTSSDCLIVDNGKNTSGNSSHVTSETHVRMLFMSPEKQSTMPAAGQTINADAMVYVSEHPPPEPNLLNQIGIAVTTHPPSDMNVSVQMNDSSPVAGATVPVSDLNSSVMEEPMQQSTTVVDTDVRVNAVQENVMDSASGCQTPAKHLSMPLILTVTPNSKHIAEPQHGTQPQNHASNTQKRDIDSENVIGESMSTENLNDADVVQDPHDNKLDHDNADNKEYAKEPNEKSLKSEMSEHDSSPKTVKRKGKKRQDKIEKKATKEKECDDPNDDALKEDSSNSHVDNEVMQVNSLLEKSGDVDPSKNSVSVHKKTSKESLSSEAGNAAFENPMVKESAENVTVPDNADKKVVAESPSNDDKQNFNFAKQSMENEEQSQSSFMVAPPQPMKTHLSFVSKEGTMDSCDAIIANIKLTQVITEAEKQKPETNDITDVVPVDTKEKADETEGNKIKPNGNDSPTKERRISIVPEGQETGNEKINLSSSEKSNAICDDSVDKEEVPDSADSNGSSVLDINPSPVKLLNELQSLKKIPCAIPEEDEEMKTDDVVLPEVKENSNDDAILDVFAAMKTPSPITSKDSTHKHKKKKKHKNKDKKDGDYEKKSKEKKKLKEMLHDPNSMDKAGSIDEAVKAIMLKELKKRHKQEKKEKKEKKRKEKEAKLNLAASSSTTSPIDVNNKKNDESNINPPPLVAESSLSRPALQVEKTVKPFVKKNDESNLHLLSQVAESSAVRLETIVKPPATTPVSQTSSNQNLAITPVGTIAPPGQIAIPFTSLKKHRKKEKQKRFSEKSGVLISATKTAESVDSKQASKQKGDVKDKILVGDKPLEDSSKKLSSKSKSGKGESEINIPKTQKIEHNDGNLIDTIALKKSASATVNSDATDVEKTDSASHEKIDNVNIEISQVENKIIPKSSGNKTNASNTKKSILEKDSELLKSKSKSASAKNQIISVVKMQTAGANSPGLIEKSDIYKIDSKTKEHEISPTNIENRIRNVKESKKATPKSTLKSQNVINAQTPIAGASFQSSKLVSPQLSMLLSLAAVESRHLGINKSQKSDVSGSEAEYQTPAKTDDKKKRRNTTSASAKKKKRVK